MSCCHAYWTALYPTLLVLGLCRCGCYRSLQYIFSDSNINCTVYGSSEQKTLTDFSYSVTRPGVQKALQWEPLRARPSLDRCSWLKVFISFHCFCLVFTHCCPLFSLQTPKNSILNIILVTIPTTYLPLLGEFHIHHSESVPFVCLFFANFELFSLLLLKKLSSPIKQTIIQASPKRNPCISSFARHTNQLQYHTTRVTAFSS